MPHGAIQHRNSLFQAQLLRLVHDERPARDKRGSVLQGRFPGHRFSRQTRIRRQKLTRTVVSSNNVHVPPLLPCHQG
ncbi:Uncharacterised protein [Klebsiella pneumoniae]|nr:Uncharacterised protein [Klebsiella pneumoniae]